MKQRKSLTDYLPSGNSREICIEPPIDAATAYTAVLLSDIPATFGFGNIGRLAVNMTANRLLSAGASPRYIAATTIVDTDTPPDTVMAVFDAMRSAAVQAQMEWTVSPNRFTTSGPRGGFAVSTFGVGQLPPDFSSGEWCARPGDSIIVTGPVGGFGAALKAVEHNLTPLMTNDGESLGDAIHALLRCVGNVHYMVYPERGISDALKSFHDGVAAEIDRSLVPVSQEVAAVCRMLGLDPLELPTAGAMLVVVGSKDETVALDALRRSAYASQAAVIGRVKAV